jgi:beta-apo-4'-carotenal oxygenase
VSFRPPFAPFRHGKTNSNPQYRLKDNESLIAEACKRDLGKSSFETYLTEVGWCMNDCIFMANNLPRFSKDEKPEDINFQNRFFGPRIRKDPLGTVLIIG